MGTLHQGSHIEMTAIFQQRKSFTREKALGSSSIGEDLVTQKFLYLSLMS